jgi:hypothetical protein
LPIRADGKSGGSTIFFCQHRRPADLVQSGRTAFRDFPAGFNGVLPLL